MVDIPRREAEGIVVLVCNLPNQLDKTEKSISLQINNVT